MTRQWIQSAIRAPRISLVVLFFAWELLLLGIALFTPGPGYDTSTQLLLKGHGTTDPSSIEGTALLSGAGGSLIARLIERLARWDAIYFASIAERGYRYEQEWAFGWGFHKLLSFLANNISLSSSRLHNVLLHGIVLANASHLLSVLVLYQLAAALPLGTKDEKGQRNNGFALIAAVLHVLAPAGIFLAAPYTESPFSLLNFAGQLFYVYSWGRDAGARTDSPARGQASYGLVNDVYLVLSGLCFGLATTVRGNGLFSGIILFHDAVLWLGLQIESRMGLRVLNLKILPPALQTEVRRFTSRRLPATILAGILVAIGFAGPQYVAWREYCGAGIVETLRPWCANMPPSVMSFVQSHYWNVGFGRYWTLSNLPLFLLAAPMLYLLLSSSYLALTGQAGALSTKNVATMKTRKAGKKNTQAATAVASSDDDLERDSIIFRLMLPQLAVASAALTTFHVQIITRMSSGYPLWYMILAKDVMEGKRTAMWTVRWAVCYALIQTVLFAGFLPPA